MTIFRVSHQKNYTVINNHICTDKTLSWKAKGIWLYAFSRPDDWSFHLNDLINQSTDGRDSVKGGLKELENAGYLRRIKVKDRHGRYLNAEWEFFETPQELKKEVPRTGNPSTEKRTLLSTEAKPSIEDIDKGNVLAMPPSKKNSKAKFPLKKDQRPYFEALKELELECDDDTLIYLVRTTPLAKLLDAIDHLKLEISKGTKFKKGRIAFFRHSLKNEFVAMNASAQENKKWAEKLQRAKWPNLKINSKYALCPETNQEIPYSLSEEEFKRLCLRVFNSRKYSN